MESSDRFHLNRITAVGLVLVAFIVALFHVTDAPAPKAGEPVGYVDSTGTVVLTEAVDTAYSRPRGGYDWRELYRRQSRRYARCHGLLVRHQDRLRRLGHTWNGERWVRRGGGR